MSEQRLERLENSLERLAGITDRFIDVSSRRFEQNEQLLQTLTAAVEELRAANRRQERIYDYLLRREQEG